MSKLRVAAVGYINARPLWEALARGPLAEQVELSLAAPSEVTRQLAEDEADVALLPVAAAAALGDVTLVDAGCISSAGPVRSVVVYSECPTDEIEELALDLSSRTSVVLARVLLRRKLGREPKLRGMKPSEALAFVGHKRGAVVIGDPALAAEGRFAHTFDLAVEWRELTGLPFVFAAWYGRRPLAPEHVALLQRARDEGLAQRDAIARACAAESGLSFESLHRYLHENIRHELGERERAGLSRFLDEAAKLDLVPRPPSESLDTLLQRAADGERLSAVEGERLHREASLVDLGLAADAVRRRKHPHGVVTYIVDRNVNYTNVCTTSCRFCAFYRPVGHAEAYVLSREELGKKLQEVVDAGGVQILLQGGLNPDLRIGWYEDLFRWIKSEYRLGLHALSPEEILHIARLEDMTVARVIERLVAAGLDSVPGGGAEILIDRVRRRIAKAKCTSEEWLSVMRTAHQMGLRSSATMMYGTVDVPRDRILHLLKIRDLQDEAGPHGGFTAFFCWDFQHESGVRVEAGDGGTHQYLRMQATSRLLLDNVEHVGASWVTQGPDVGQIALRFGADDFGSVMFEENVVSSAGTTYCIDAHEIERRIRSSGFRAARRNVKYEWLTQPT
ncbi:MAG TPA: cyclic dehypoxanthinyl futalosine synthase [Polyangiaceae bacterium]|nr:cyclic dehypoxanthinyl futalosine synthase [Polyangiaceae bacterium]